MGASMGDIELSTTFLLVIGSGLLVGGLITIWLLNNVSGAKWVVLAALLCISCFDLPKLRDQEWQERIGHPMPIPPLQLLRTHARLLTLIPLAVVSGYALATIGNVRRVPVMHAVFLSVLAYQMILVAKMVYLNIGLKAIGYSMVFPLNYVVFCFGITAWMRSRSDVLWAARSIGISVTIFFFLCAVQVPFSYIALFSHHMRFTGMTANAQHAAVMMAITLPVVIHLSRRADELSTLRLYWWTLTWVICFGIVLTASRTGALMMIVSLGVMYRRYLQIILLSGLFMAIGMLILRSDDSGNPLEYYTSRGNTREGTWSSAFDDFSEEPLFGKTEYETGVMSFCENSWLAMASTTGVIGLSVMLVALGIVVQRIRQLAMIPLSGDERDLQNLIVASMLSLFIGSIFEAFLLGAVVFPMFAAYTVLGMANWLVTLVRSRRTVHLSNSPRPPVVRSTVMPLRRNIG